MISYFFALLLRLMSLSSLQVCLQESWAIAKMTAWCALCMGAMKIFGSPWLRPWLLFSKF